MKSTPRRLAWLLAALVLAAPSAPAAEATVQSETKALVEQIGAKIQIGQRTEAALAPELAALDALLARHAGEKTEDLATVLIVKASLYAQVFQDADKAIALVRQIKSDFPASALAAKADDMIAGLERQQESNRIQRALAPGTKFPEFAETDVSGRLLSPATYKGKVVLIDFWATWCGPCREEMPNVVRAYEKFHAQGFEIIGISLDRAGDGQKLADYTREHGMPWAQIYDGKYGQSKLAAAYGVSSIPASYLLDADGHIVAKDLRGEELEKELTRLLAKK